MLDANTLLDALTTLNPFTKTVDEMRHSGGAGISFLERWPATMNTGMDRHTATVWIWRVMWVSRKSDIPVRIAFGASPAGEPGARKDAAVAARRLAKLRRMGGE